MNGAGEIAVLFTQACAHFLWVGALVWLGVFVIGRVFARSAAARHAVLLVGLLAMAAAFPLCFLLPGGASVGRSSAVRTSGDSVDLPSSWETNGEHLLVSRTVPVEPAGFKADEDTVIETYGPVGAATQERTDAWSKAAPWVSAIYLGGLLAMSLRLILGWAGSGRLRNRAEPIVSGPWHGALERMRCAVGTKSEVALAWSREVASPVVVGLLKPAVLLPVALASRLSPAQVEAVLAHELAHLSRGDHRALVVQRIVETVLFFHPAVWWMSRRMESAREEACDDRVLAAGCDPADYAEALVICSECRLERAGVSTKFAERLAATGEAPLRHRVLRLLGHGDDGNVRLGRAGWVLALLVLSGAALTVAAGGGRDDLADFDFKNPPGAYEKGVEVADSRQHLKVDGITFQAGPLEWRREGWLRLPGGERGPGQELFLNLGTSGGFEIVSFRLFDHATRELIHDSHWQHLGNTEQQQQFFIERIGTTNWVRLKEMHGTLPERIDVWMRIATQDKGPVVVLDGKEGASKFVGGGELVITKLLPGSTSGKSGPTGEMEWDTSKVRDQDRALTVNLENRGKLLEGRFHLVAVKKDGSRHPLDHTHFWDFRRTGSHGYFHMDIALPDLDHFELIPFKNRHKFFFNGLEVPAKGAPSPGPEPEDLRVVFRFVERFARLPEGDQAVKLEGFYDGLSSKSLGPWVEMILSNAPQDIFDPGRAGGPFDGNTARWARQLEEAAETMSVEEVADRFEGPVWIRVASRARALQVFERHAEATAKLIGRDLDSGSKEAIERATAVIHSLQLRGFSKRLLELWLEDGVGAQAAWGALLFMRDPGVVGELRQRVGEEPAFITRCSGLFQGPLAGEKADPLLLGLLDSPDAEIRYHAANALQDCVDPGLAHVAFRLAGEKEARFRFLAAHMVGRLPGDAFGAARGEMLPLLSDVDDEVRFYALLKFAERKDLAAGPVILDALRGEAPKEQYRIWVMQAMAALSDKSWHYDMHHWGPEGPGNREAIERFEAWLEERRSDAGLIQDPSDDEWIAKAEATLDPDMLQSIRAGTKDPDLRLARMYDSELNGGTRLPGAQQVAERHYLAYLPRANDTAERCRIHTQLGVLFSTNVHPEFGEERDSPKARRHFANALEEEPDRIGRATIRARLGMVGADLTPREQFEQRLENYRWLTSFDETELRRKWLPMAHEQGREDRHFLAFLRNLENTLDAQVYNLTFVTGSDRDALWRLRRILEVVPETEAARVAREKLESIVTVVIQKEMGGVVTPGGVGFSMDSEQVMPERIAEWLKEKRNRSGELKLHIQMGVGAEEPHVGIVRAAGREVGLSESDMWVAGDPDERVDARSEPRPELKEVRSEKLGIRFKVPRSWNPAKAAMKDALRFETPGEEIVEKDEVIPYLVMNMRNIGVPTTINITDPPGADVDDHRIFTVAGVPARLTGYDRKGTTHLTVQFAKETRSYTITFGFPTAKKDRFLQHVDAVSESVEFLPPPETEHKEAKVRWQPFKKRQAPTPSSGWWGGHFQIEGADDLQDYRLALGVLELDGEGKIRAHVGAGGSNTPLAEFRKVTLEIDHADVENAEGFQRLHWKLSRSAVETEGSDETTKNLGIEADSHVAVQGSILVDRMFHLETGFFRPLARVRGAKWDRDLVLVGMLLAPDDDYEGFNAKELREHWHRREGH